MSYQHRRSGPSISFEESAVRGGRAENYEKSNMFVKQAAIFAGAGILTRILGFAYRMPLTHLIGDEGNGINAIGFDVYMFFLVMSSAGLPVAISKMVSERNAVGRPDEAHRVFRTALIVAAVLGLISSLMIFFGSRFIVSFLDERSYYALVVLTPTVFIVAIMAVFRGYFQGMQNAAPTALSQLIEQLLNAIFSVFLAYLLMNTATPYSHGGDPVAMGAAGSTAGTGIGAFAGLVFIMGLYYLKRREIADRIDFYSVGAKGGRQPAGSIAKELMVIAIPIILGTAIFTFSNLIDAFMIMGRLEASGVADPDVRVALFGQLKGKYVTITNLPVAISTAFAMAAIPSIAASVVMRERKIVNDKINTAIRISMLITIPFSVGIGVFANQILQLLFPSYPEGGILLTVGAISIIFLALYQILAGTLQAIGALHVPVVAALAGALLKIPMNYILIGNPNIRVTGAVISTIACYSLASAICWNSLQKRSRAVLDWKNILIKPAAASAVMGMGSFVIYYTIVFMFPSVRGGMPVPYLGNALALIIAAAAAVTFFAAYLLMLGGVKKSDVRLLPMGKKLADVLEKKGLVE
jgi:stage V sporulation protein B